MSFRLAEATGTCEGACDHYLSCKGDASGAAQSTCVAECREIFAYDGEEDRMSLLDFESMQCEAAVAFVDGDGNPDRRTQDDAVRASQAR